MKKILIALPALFLLAAGCVSSQPTTNQAPTENNINQAVVPAKVPDSWTTYKSKYGYEVSFPNESGWEMVDQTIGQTYAYNDEYLMAPNTGGCMMDDGGDCPQIFLQISALNDRTPPKINSSLNGIPAGRSGDSLDSYSYKVQNGNNVFQINFKYVGTMKFSKDIAEAVLGTFKFTDSNKSIE